MTLPKLLCASTVTALMTFAVATHAAPGNGKGERASLNGVTVCAVDGTTLHAQARLTDTSTGNAVPVVVASTFQGLAKVGKGNWKTQNWGDAIVPFDLAVGDYSGPVSGSAEINASLDLCLLKPYIGDVKAVNVMATIIYDRDTGGDAKTLQNMCGDDPATEEIEPDGIALTSAMVAAIEAGCF